jgi:hypothetical protein
MQFAMSAEHAASEAPIFTQTFFTLVQLLTHLAACAEEIERAISARPAKIAIFIPYPPLKRGIIYPKPITTATGALTLAESLVAAP